MKAGDYVRTKNGYIGKIYNINEFREPSMMYAIDIPKTDDFVFMGEKDFKSSPNIIDLIEVGDYVNGYYVEDVLNTFVNVATGSNYFQNPTIYEEDIKSIVTKEQFESVKYEIYK